MQKCAKWSGKIGETKKSDTAFEESCERITQQASTLACSFRFVIILETRAKACYAARPTSRTISRIITGNKVNGGGNDPPRNKRATRNPVSEVGRHAGTAASCWRQLSALISFHFLALERARGRRGGVKRYRSKKTRSNLFFHRAVRKGFVTFDSRKF